VTEGTKNDDSEAMKLGVHTYDDAQAKFVHFSLYLRSYST